MGGHGTSISRPTSQSTAGPGGIAVAGGISVASAGFETQTYDIKSGQKLVIFPIVANYHLYNSGYPQTGYPQTGYPQTGYPQTSYPQMPQYPTYAHQVQPFFQQNQVFQKEKSPAVQKTYRFSATPRKNPTVYNQIDNNEKLAFSAKSYDAFRNQA